MSSRLADDKWWKAQEITFTKWVNSSMRGHRTSNGNKIGDLATDLRDGRVLAELLESQTKKKLNYTKEDKHLKFKSQELENLGVSFRFMKQENIKLVNIGPEDIYNGNLKLILGLIWTLIGRYQIRSTGRALSTKDAMLAWINTQILGKNIKNFTTDWNDGVAICALVDRVSPGLIPHHDSLNRADKLKNCTLGMGLADDKLDIPKILDPEDLSHPDVDELSVMTYISFFCVPINNHLLKWVQAMIPHQNMKNFTTDWNDGVKLGHLLEALNPGGFPDCKKLDPNDALENLTRGMQLSEEQLGIKPVLTPKQMADPRVDELNIVTYISRFQNAKPLPQPKAISCSGDGLRKASVGKEAVFEVDTMKGGSGDLLVEIAHGGKALKHKMNPLLGKAGIFDIQYTPDTAGDHSVAIKWGGIEIPVSPYIVKVADPRAVAHNMPSHVQVGEPFDARLDTQKAGEGQAEMKSSNSRVLAVEFKERSGEIKLLPKKVGETSVAVEWNGDTIPNTPHDISVVDATKCTAYGAGLTEGKAKTKELFEFMVHTKGAGKGELSVSTKTPKSTSLPADIKKISEDKYGVSFTPFEVGDHFIKVMWCEREIPDSPYKVDFYKPAAANTFTATGDGLKTATAKSVAKFMIVGPESGLVASKVLDISIGNASVKSTMVMNKAEFRPESGKAAVFASDNGNGMYAVDYAVPAAGKYSLSITSNGDHIPGSPFAVAVLPAADPSKCVAFGRAIDEPSMLLLQNPLEFKVDSTDAGSGELSVTCKNPKSAAVPVFLAEEKGGSGKRIHAVKIDVSVRGKHLVTVQWNGMNIPKSPFTFHINDLKDVIVIDLPDSAEYVGRKGEPIAFSVDTNKVGPGELKGAARYDNGKVEAFAQKKNRDGTVLLSHPPTKEGKLELLLTFAGANLLPQPWVIEVTDPSAFKVIPPEGPGKKGEYVKFVIAGLNKKLSKNAVITAKNRTHNATVKLEFNDQAGNSVARFTAKELGEYRVEVKVAKKDIPGSPFTCIIVNPEACLIEGSVPSLVPVGEERQFMVDTANTGPGELVAKCTGQDGASDNCLLVTVSNGAKKAVKMTGKSCGRISLGLTFSGYAIPSMPVDVVVTDPSKCMYACEGIDNDLCKTNSSITIDVDTTEGGNCAPEVIVSGPKSNYDVTLKKVSQGRYTATLTPWQDGKNKIRVTVAGVDVAKSPRTFESRKPLETDKVTVSGPGLKGAIANRRAEITIYARESMLVDRGILNVAFKDSSVSDLEVYDKNNGTYSVSFTPKEKGVVKLCVTGDGRDIAGSPFNITVVPEPDGSRCRVVNRASEEVFKDSSFIYHQVRTPFELGVITAEAGSGTLQAEGKAPNKSQIRVFTNSESVKGESATFIKFDPTSVGVYTLSLSWDEQPLRGSPYTIKVVDSSKCESSEPFPSCVKLGGEATYNIDTSSAGAGEGEVEVSVKNGIAEATVKEGSSPGAYVVTFKGLLLGSTTVDIKFAGYSVGSSPYALTVCDPSKCRTDFVPGVYNVNVPFKFNVTASNAGRAKLQVTSSKKSVAVTRNVTNSTWEVTFTPKKVGEQNVSILWGDWNISESPYAITVCDPGQVKLRGLPLPNNVLLMGEPVSFTVDTTEAGSGTLVCRTVADGVAEDVNREETDGNEIGITSMQFIPKAPGKLQLVLEFNGMDVLRRPHVYDVPDPSQFQVTPPKGYARVRERVAFTVTGVERDTELAITATHQNHTTVAVATEREAESGVTMARLTPNVVGSYQIEAKHADRHIQGSPFAIKVCDPDACRFIEEPPTVVHVGVEPNIQVDPTDAGPGELTFETEVISGMENASTENQGTTKWVLSMDEGVGKVRITALWAGYNIPQSPFVLTIVDSQRVTWSCQALDGGDKRGTTVNQGELLKVAIDGKEAGEVLPEIVARGPDEDYPVKIADHEDGTYTVTLNAWQIGRNEITILWGGRQIPHTPIAFDVAKGIEGRAVTLSGRGLEHAIALADETITINAIEPGLLERGLIEVKFESGEGEKEVELPTYSISDKGDGKYELAFVAPKEGTYPLSITYQGEHIPISPLDVKVYAATSAGNCRVYGEAFEKNPAIFMADEAIKFSVDSSKAGSGSLATSANGPDDEPIYVYAVEEGDNHHLKFDPVLIGHYAVEVKWGGANVPGSPFDFNVVDPSMCVLEGVPPEGGHILLEEPVDFTVHMTGVGECNPEAKVSVNGKTSDLECSEEVERSFGYSYVPKTPGKTSISVTVAGKDVPKSPVKFNTVDPNMFSITTLSLEGDYAIVCEPVTLEIIGQGSEEGEELFVTAHGPSADLSVETVEKEKALHTATFVPIEPGSYEVFVEYAGSHVNGSPLSIKVADPSQCQLLGGMLSTLQVGEVGEVTVKTRGAGEGVMEAAVKHEDDAFPVLECEVKDLGLDTYTVALTGKDIGKATIDLRWAGFSIPSSPFLVNVCNASLCSAHGKILTSKKGKAGSPVTFVVETANAGEAELEVTAKGPSAQYTVNISELKESTYEVSFTPWEIGEHSVCVLWGKGDIPESPFSIDVGSPMDMEICNATGDGLKHGIASQTATFKIICSEPGLLDKDVLKVNVMGVTTHAKVAILDGNDGSYTVEYVPPIPGAYVASVLFHDRHIPGSPFKVTVDSGPDASKCKAYGPALHPNTLAIAGSPLDFFVDTTAAGYGRLKVYIQGPSDYKPKVFLADDEKGIYSVKFDAMKSGRYFVLVRWSDKEIPNSPFKIRVHPAANAAKVKASGPGLLDSFIGTPGQFTIETKNAGIGTLLIRIHGLKDSFKIEAQPISETDTRTLIITYNPKLVGEYTIFVRWSGVHIPGSPYTLNIKQRPGENDPSVIPIRKKAKRKVSSTQKKAPPPQDIQVAQQAAPPAGKTKQRPDSVSSSKKSAPQTPQRKLSPAPQPHLQKSPSGNAIGMSLMGPGMRLKDNPAMAMSLAQYPPGYSAKGGYVAAQDAPPSQQRKVVVKKKVVRKVVRKRHRSSSGARARSTGPGTSAAVPGRTTSPRRGDPPPRRSRAVSPGGDKDPRRQAQQKKPISPSRTDVAKSPRESTVTSPARKPTSPARKATSPERKPTSPARKPTSPARKATSPARQATSTSPTHRRPTSPAQKSLSPAARKAASPAPKGKPKKRMVKKGDRAKSPPGRHPPPKGKSPPSKKDAKR